MSEPPPEADFISEEPIGPLPPPLAILCFVIATLSCSITLFLLLLGELPHMMFLYEDDFSFLRPLSWATSGLSWAVSMLFHSPFETYFFFTSAGIFCGFAFLVVGLYVTKQSRRNNE